MSKQKNNGNPFPGLRPFESNESHLFFGRDGQSDELIRRLRINRFLAVVGTSGSGKSSLVRAGLLPALHGGFMAGTGSHWRVAIFRPGGNPIGNLAEALYKSFVSASEKEAKKQDDPTIGTAIAEATLRRSDMGIAEAVKQTGISKEENLLIVVDQFEELFRFKASSDVKDAHNEAAAFVKLLLNAAKQADLPIYVVITMRSDYLGDCAQFRDLPETINDSQYLIPRMTRDQRRQAITGPIAVGGAQITERLVQQLLNDMGDNPDQLPILQHALMRSWDFWQRQNQNSAPLDLDHYEKIGRMEHALSNHADEAFNELAENQSKKTGKRRQELAEKLFRCITELGKDNREIRRSTKLKDICEIVAADENEMIDVIDIFRKEGRCFLMPPEQTPLNKDSLIDISHESLIRQWKKLNDWVKKEDEDRKMYERIVDAADRYFNKRTGGLWHDPDLQYALGWREEAHTTNAWAQRYQPNFKLKKAFDFLNKSRQRRDIEIVREKERQQKELKRTRRFAAVIMAASLIAIVGAVIAFSQRNHARQRTYEANYNLAKVYEEKAGIVLADTLENKNRTENYQQAWLYTLQAMAQDIGPGRRLPASISRIISSRLLASAFSKIWTSPHPPSHVYSVAFSPDGKLLASGSEDHSIRLWDMKQGMEVIALIDHLSPVLSVAFSHDGKLLASGSGDEFYSIDNRIRLWDVQHRTEVNILIGHNAAVRSVIFSSDDKLIASASSDSTVRLWDIAQQKQIAVLSGHLNAVNSVTFSSDNKLVASASSDSTILLWDVALQEQIAKLIGHTNAVNYVAFSPDAKLLASASSDGTIRLWDVGKQKQIAILAGHNDIVNCVAFSPDGKLLVSGSSDRTIRLWDVSQHKELASATGHTESVKSVAFSFDGKLFASGSSDQTIRLWDMNRSVELARLPGHTETVIRTTLSPDGRLLASASGDRTVRLWDIVQGKEIATLTKFPEDDDNIIISSMVFSPDCNLLAVATGTLLFSNHQAPDLLRDFTIVTGNVRYSHKKSGLEQFEFSHSVHLHLANNTIHLCDIAQRKEIATLTNNDSIVTTMVFSNDNKLLVSGSNDRRIRLWDVIQRKEIASLTGHKAAITSVAFSPDDKLLATGSRDSSIILWNVAKPKKLTTLIGHTASVQGLVFSPSGEVLVSGAADKTIRFWDVIQGTELGILTGNTGSVDHVEFYSNRKFLASAPDDSSFQFCDFEQDSEFVYHKIPNAITTVDFDLNGKLVGLGESDKSIQLWDVEQQTKTMTMTGHNAGVSSVAFSPDGKLLASGAFEHGSNNVEHGIGLWDVATRKLVSALKGHESGVTSVAFSPDSKLLASGSVDCTIRLWDVKQRRELASLAGHTAPVWSVAFSPDGKLLASASQDNTIRLWDLVQRKELSSLTGHTAEVWSVAFSPNGKVLASGSSDCSIRLWDIKRKKELSILLGHTSSVLSVAFSPDSKLLASGTGLETLGTEKNTGIWLWDVDQKKQITTFSGHIAAITSLMFSPDGKLLASGSEDKSIRLWDVVQHLQFATLTEHTGYVTSVAFSPDGKLLASGSYDKSIRLWDVGILDYFMVDEKKAPTFNKIYEASFYLFPYRFSADGLNLEPKPKELYLAPVGDYKFPRPRKYEKLDRPRPPGKDPIEWMLENM